MITEEELVEKVARAISYEHFMGKQWFGHCPQEEMARYMSNQYWRNHLKHAYAAIDVIAENDPTR